MEIETENESSPLVLVTGASGYIASHVIQQLQQKGYRVRGTVRNLKDEKKLEHLKNLCPDAKHELELVEADLSQGEEKWKSIVEDCTYVLHVASPLPLSRPSDENEVIEPAVKGTTSVLKACACNGSVKRVVLTSSIAAIAGNWTVKERPYNETDWTELNESLAPYEKSKTLAEKTAWEYVKSLKEEDKFELAVINPGYVIGPSLGKIMYTSLTRPKQLLERSMPGVPKASMPFTDVRDVAASHVTAMTVPEAAGNRHIISEKEMWYKELALVLNKEFHSQGYNVPTKEIPSWMIKFVSLFDKNIALIKNNLDKMSKYDNTRMRTVLKIAPRDMESTITDMAYSAIDCGLIKKTSKYRGSDKNAQQH